MLKRIIKKVRQIIFGFSSGQYWNSRYEVGGTSGEGSYGKFARFKADAINRFMIEHRILSIIEFGCGDGNQLALINTSKYIGVDVSTNAVEKCRRLYRGDSGKTFLQLNKYRGEMADMGMSLDVIYHLVEDEIYEKYMETLFNASRKYVVIYSSNTDVLAGYVAKEHVRHRKFSALVESRYPQFRLINTVKNHIHGMRRRMKARLRISTFTSVHLAWKNSVHSGLDGADKRVPGFFTDTWHFLYIGVFACSWRDGSKAYSSHSSYIDIIAF